MIAFLVLVGRRARAVTLPPGAPLRDPVTGDIIGTTPFMDSLLFIIAMIFLVAGIGYGIGAGTFKSSNDVIAAVTKTFAGLGGLVFMLLMISQFIAYFNYSQHAERARDRRWRSGWRRAGIGALPLLIGMIVVIAAPRHHHAGADPEVGDLRPDLRPAVHPAGRRRRRPVLAAYRVGDSPLNVDHAADGLPAVHGHDRPALQDGRRASARSSR